MVSLCVLRFHTNVYGYQYYTFFISNTVRERKKNIYIQKENEKEIYFIEAFKYIISVHIPLKVFCVKVYLIYTLCIKYM